MIQHEIQVAKVISDKPYNLLIIPGIHQHIRIYKCVPLFSITGLYK